MNLHLYSEPQSTLVKFTSRSISEEDKVTLLPVFVHITFGAGLPVALQKRTTLLPSMTVLLEGATTISGASKTKNTPNQDFKYKIEKNTK